MTYLIDGHNLIPHIPGLSLDQLDDEMELVTLLVNFSNKNKSQVEVYFDHGNLNSERDFQRGRVHAHFVLPPMIADNAMLSRLLGIGRAAKNYIVVTSDQNIQNRARRVGAAVMSSQNFAQLLHNSIDKISRRHSGQKPADNEKEIDEWLNLFNEGKSDPPKT
jgi:predicted RNA-binding protein with PIN domain